MVATPSPPPPPGLEERNLGFGPANIRLEYVAT